MKSHSFTPRQILNIHTHTPSLYCKCNFPMTPTVRWSVNWSIGQLAGWSVCHDFGSKLHFHAPIGALVLPQFSNNGLLFPFTKQLLKLLICHLSSPLPCKAQRDSSPPSSSRSTFYLIQLMISTTHYQPMQIEKIDKVQSFVKAEKRQIDRYLVQDKQMDK